MANNTSDDELQKKLRYLVFGVVSYKKEGVEDDFITVTDNLMDKLTPFIKQREEQVAREARIDELKQSRLTEYNSEASPIGGAYVAARLAQLTTTHKGDK